uniref:Uncharacterized protein n=1 Tax=Panagrolaimus sp. PS1159 TaxID=55785 RepID=A0AC35GR76_9BILA
CDCACTCLPKNKPAQLSPITTSTTAKLFVTSSTTSIFEIPSSTTMLPPTVYLPKITTTEFVPPKTQSTTPATQTPSAVPIATTTVIASIPTTTLPLTSTSPSTTSESTTEKAVTSTTPLTTIQSTTIPTLPSEVVTSTTPAATTTTTRILPSTATTTELPSSSSTFTIPIIHSTKTTPLSTFSTIGETEATTEIATTTPPLTQPSTTLKHIPNDLQNINTDEEDITDEKVLEVPDSIEDHTPFKNNKKQKEVAPSIDENHINADDNDIVTTTISTIIEKVITSTEPSTIQTFEATASKTIVPSTSKPSTVL